MSELDLPDDFYKTIKPRLHKKIGRELRLAGTVVDIGCGPCDLVQYLAEAYRQKVIGIDISSRTFPGKRHTYAGVRFRCIAKDATHLDFIADQSIDAVVTMWALHEMVHPRLILSETYRIIRPGGEILVIDFPRDSLAQRLWNEEYYHPSEIVRILSVAGFDQVRARLIEKAQIAWVRGWKHPKAIEEHG